MRLVAMHSAVTEGSIEKANAQFWEQMLAMRLEAVGATAMRSIGTHHVAGSCDLTGAWNGRIEVRLSRGLAICATSAMLMLPADALQAADTLDATKEIANMIAGTLKSALPRPCAMTVPSAEVVPEDFCVLPRTADSLAVFFFHEAGELMVRVCEAGVSVVDDEGESSLECASPILQVSF